MVTPLSIYLLVGLPQSLPVGGSIQGLRAHARGRGRTPCLNEFRGCQFDWMTARIALPGILGPPRAGAREVCGYGAKYARAPSLT